jgi:hypothetical protein|tara:strand:+ start:719 stop:976 length:258 start_codon:yes stop_codon:yes gene_type:complete
MSDWMDEVLDGKPLEAEWWKVGYIENLLPYTSITQTEKDEIYNRLTKLTDIEADELIPYLKENEIHLDPKHQYEAMRKNGMFNPK